ncbi:MAG: AAA family ATPase [Desulfovermiculus sp.]
MTGVLGDKKAPGSLAASRGQQQEAKLDFNLRGSKSEVNPLESFAEAIRNAGLPCPNQLIPDGQLHRFPTNGNESDNAGYYALFDNGGGHYGGFFGCWRSGVEETWKSASDDLLSEQERDQLNQRIERRRKEAREARQKARAEAKQKAQEEYENAKPAQGHPYLSEKGVGTYGMLPLKVNSKGNLLIPVHDIDANIHSRQEITPDGDKYFLKDGATRGMFHVIDGKQDQIVIAEGYATAASIHEATGATVIVAFNAGNLRSVAEQTQKVYPDKILTIAADNDRWTSLPDGRVNPGLIRAQEAAKAVNGRVICPEFKKECLKGKPKDFNDLAQLEGLEAVKKAFSESKQQTLKLIDWIASQAFPGTPGKREYLLGGKFPMGQVSVLASSGGIGKSGISVSLVSEVARDIVTGFQKTCLGGEVQVYGKAVYLSGEDDHLELHGRLYHLQATGLKNLIAVPLPSVGGAQAFFKMDPHTREPTATPAFYDFVDQLRSLDDLKVVIIDPLQVFCHLDLNLPENAQAVCSKLSAIAADTGAAVIITHHFRKTRVNGPESAREAIRGTAGLVDGVRSVYALWLPSSENAKSNPRALCRRLGVSYAPDKIVQGAIVKANGDADKSISTFVRDDRGFLEDVTMQIAHLDVNADLGNDLLEHIAQAAKDGRPYTKTGANGLYERRHEMAERFHMVSKHKFTELADELLQIKQLTIAMGPGSKVVKYLDVPDGPFARGQGQFVEGASVTK